MTTIHGLALGTRTGFRTAGRGTLLGILAGAALAVSAMAQSTCRAADETSQAMLPVVDSIVNGRSPRHQVLRDSVGLSAPASPVTPSLVSSASICQQAGAALDTLDGTGPTNRTLYVYAAGAYYAVDDPNRLMGEFRPLFFYTSSWVYKGAIVQ